MMLTHTFSVEQATNIAFKLLDILFRVHDKGVIHSKFFIKAHQAKSSHDLGDIKPSNVIMFNESLYLIDFGVSCLVSDDVHHEFFSKPKLILFRKLHGLGQPCFQHYLLC